MILLLLKVTLLLAGTLAVTASMRRASAALRHLICVCGLSGALLLALTLLTPAAGPALFRITAFTMPGAVRVKQASVGFPLGVLPWLWLAGTVVVLLRLAVGFARVARLRRSALPSAEPGIMFADVEVPVATGLLSPRILLPHEAAAWPAERLDAVLRHERAHLRRADLWTLLLSQLTSAVYWFHPLIWLVAAQLRVEQEQACDDAVLLSGFEPASYAEALLAAAQNLTSTEPMGCPMVTHKALTTKTFRSRIARLLSDGMPRVSSSATLRFAAIAFAGAVLTIGLVSAQDQDGAYKVGNGVSQPHVTFHADPVYTTEARDAHIEGSVLLSVIIGTDGEAHSINVTKKLGGGLDEKAVEAVQKWRFQPGTKDGQPVNVRATIEVNFKLQ
jgi:TonB family protein